MPIVLKTETASGVRDVERTVTIVPVALVGRGNVGRALLRQIVGAKTGIAGRGVVVRVNAVIGRSGAMVAADGLDDADLVGVADGKGAEAAEHGTPLGWENVTTAIDDVASAGQIVIDATAEDNAAVHAAWVARGWHVVTANKKPLTASLAQYDALVGAPHRAAAQYRYETTVGAGLPIISTLRDLLTTGDEVLEIRGAVSGTLGFLCSACEEGVPFAQAVAEAKARGFTEPDPRQDLSGSDVCRKALILGRLIGVRKELADIAAESLVPAPLADVDRAAFLAGLPAHGAPLDERFRVASGCGNALRYMLTVSPDNIRVGLEEVPRESPFGSLKGPENMFVIRTRRYDANPLIVRGPGAGADVTAAGIFGDVLRIVRL